MENRNRNVRYEWPNRVNKTNPDNLEENNGTDGHFIEEKVTEDIGAKWGLSSFVGDLFRFTVVCCMLYGAFRGGVFYARKTYTPKRIEIQQNFHGLDVVVNGIYSDLVYDKRIK